MIRAAGTGDIPELIEMAYALHAESHDSKHEIVNVGGFLDHYIQGESKVVFIDTEDRGFLLGRMHQHPLFRVKWGVEEYWYVKPDYRGSSVGLKLLKHFTAWAKANGADEMLVTHGSGIKVDSLGKLLTRKGYDCVGGMYRKELNG